MFTTLLSVMFKNCTASWAHSCVSASEGLAFSGKHLPFAQLKPNFLDTQFVRVEAESLCRPGYACKIALLAVTTLNCVP
jgi:hypothetical protein